MVFSIELVGVDEYVARIPFKPNNDKTDPPE
jgi:hypothetical protein